MVKEEGNGKKERISKRRRKEPRETQMTPGEEEGEGVDTAITHESLIAKEVKCGRGDGRNGRKV